MNNNSEISIKVTGKIDVIIRATQPDVNLDEPFYAINWFSTKVEWLYHFYNLLAIRSVKKNGGRAFFKAKVRETLLDEAKGRRDLILIVRYPSGLNFKSLMESTYFKIVSIFRVLSVSKFTFGLTHKLASDPNSGKEDGLHYAIHHFISDKAGTTTFQSIQHILPKSIAIKYAGHTIATLKSKEKNKLEQQVPNLMDGLFIFQSSDEINLRTFFASNDYLGFLETLQSSHISLLNRL
jgi:hypothetical protein